MLQDHKQKFQVKASWAKIQQIYENMELDLDLKLLLMFIEAYYKSGLYYKYLVNPRKLGLFRQMFKA